MIRWVTWPQLPCQDMPRYAKCTKDSSSVCIVRTWLAQSPSRIRHETIGTIGPSIPAMRQDLTNLMDDVLPELLGLQTQKSSVCVCECFFFISMFSWWFLSIVMASGNWRMRLELQWLSCWGFQMMMREIGCDFWYFCSWFEGRRDRRSRQFHQADWSCCSRYLWGVT